MRMMTVLAAMLLTLGASALPRTAQADDPRLLGVTYLTRVENDKDVLAFAKCRKGINAVQIRIDRGQVEIERLWVRYKNGAVDTLPLRERIPEHGQSRWIDLRGGERCVKAIGVIGDTELSRDQARVEIWGR